MGRRTKKTDPRVEALLNVLRVGNTRRAACAHADIEPATFYRWHNEDATFRDAVQKAEGLAEGRFLAQIARAATGGTWQAAAWILECRYPDDYGRRERVDVQIDVAREAQQLAEEYGVDAEDVIAAADRVAERNR